MIHESKSPRTLGSIDASVDTAPHQATATLIALDEGELADVAGGDRWGAEGGGGGGGRGGGGGGGCARSGIYLFCAR